MLTISFDTIITCVPDWGYIYMMRKRFLLCWGRDEGNEAWGGVISAHTHS